VTRLAEKVAIITGGSRGQGAEEARLFTAEGAAVAICDVLETEGEALAAELSSQGHAARFYKLDVADPADWDSVAQEVIAWQGKVSCLVNNAGIINRTSVLATSTSDWRRVLDVNLSGAFYGVRSIAPLMMKSGGGSIINVASVAARTGHMDVAYASTKAGLLGLTRSAAAELARHSIRVNAICPGIVVTGLNAGGAHLDAWRSLTPVGRYGTVSEIANLVLFLASDESNFITGEDIAIDGGLLAGGLSTFVQSHVETH
jgi:3alpha(or 20beta)-hydroxysteroid dehydrogenase